MDEWILPTNFIVASIYPDTKTRKRHYNKIIDQNSLWLHAEMLNKISASLIQQHIKDFIQHDQMEFILAM